MSQEELNIYTCSCEHYKLYIKELEEKLKWITDLHAEVSGRNVTLYCRNAELERMLKEADSGRGTKPEV